MSEVNQLPGVVDITHACNVRGAPERANDLVMLRGAVRRGNKLYGRLVDWTEGKFLSDAFRSEIKDWETYSHAITEMLSAYCKNAQKNLIPRGDESDGEGEGEEEPEGSSKNAEE